MPKKSFYVFLAALLGVLLFLILHRVAVFFYLFLIAGNYIEGGSFYGFLITDYLSMTITMMLGGWYGIWLGMGWFEKVYETNSHGGFVHHIATKVFPTNPPYNNLPRKMSSIRERLEADVSELEDLAQRAVSKASTTPKVVKPKSRRALKKS